MSDVSRALTLKGEQRDATGSLIGSDLRVIYGNETTSVPTGPRTMCVERTNLTSRHMNGRLVRKTLGYSKRVEMLKAACDLGGQGL